MAYDEYLDIFLESQSKGIYHMIVFDLINSKTIPPKERALLQEKMRKLCKLVFNHLVELENTTNREILVKDANFFRPWEIQKKDLGYRMDPILFGDCIGFTVYKDSITKEFLIEIFNRYKEELKIENDFHIADGYYETNDYALGAEKCFRGYCFQTLESYHKASTQKRLTKILASRQVLGKKE